MLTNDAEFSEKSVAGNRQKTRKILSIVVTHVLTSLLKNKCRTKALYTSCMSVDCIRSVLNAVPKHHNDLPIARL